MKNQIFFLGKLNQYFLLYIVITLVILNTEFGLIWAAPWPNEKQIFLKFSKIRNSRNSQNTVWKPNFFLGKLYQQLFGFTLSLHWWYSIPSLVWFGQLLDPMKKNFFKVLKNSQFAKFAKFRITNLFLPRQAIPTTFCFTLSLHWWYSIPRLVWFGQLLNPKKKNFLKIPFSRNSKCSVWKRNFSPSQAKPKILFALHCHYTGDTQCQVWFDLDNSLTRWRRTFLKFSKTRNSRNSQNSVSKTIFSLASYTNKFFALHSHYMVETQ